MLHNWRFQAGASSISCNYMFACKEAISQVDFAIYFDFSVVKFFDEKLPQKFHFPDLATTLRRMSIARAGLFVQRLIKLTQG